MYGSHFCKRMTFIANSTNIVGVQEEVILKRLLARDRRAVREFYIHFSPRLLRYIRRKINDEEDVVEIAQDTLFAFLEGVRDFTGRCSLNTYLCSIAHHKIVDFYRKKRLKRIVFSQLPEGFEIVVSELADPQKMLDDVLTRQKIAHVFTRLSPHYAKVLKLKYIEGRSVVEIATKLAYSFKSVESILFRARQAFVKLYTKG